MATEEGQTWSVDTEQYVHDIDEVELHGFDPKPVGKFLVAFLVGAVFFLLPVPYQGELTVPFDIVVSIITETFPDAVGAYSLLVIRRARRSRYDGAIASLPAVRVTPRSRPRR